MKKFQRLTCSEERETSGWEAVCRGVSSTPAAAKVRMRKTTSRSPGPLSAGAPSAGPAGCRTAPAALSASLAAPCSPPGFYSCCSPNLSSLSRSCSPAVKKLEFLWKQSIKNYHHPPIPLHQVLIKHLTITSSQDLHCHMIVNVKESRAERRNRRVCFTWVNLEGLDGRCAIL